MTDAPPAVSAASTVSLRPVTTDTLGAILKLEVAPAQKRFVASNAVSLAQAHFYKDAWYRAIYADETPVGFLMLSDEPLAQEYFLWRLMVAEPYQRMGFARRAIDLLVDYVKTRPGATELLVSHVEGEGNPGPFYESCGFEYTGQLLEGELVMRLPLPDVGSVAAEPAAEPRPLTHVVLFKLKDRSPENAARAATMLRSLEGVVPTLQAIEVSVNMIPAARAFDIALFTRFASLADMEAYQIHPRHQAVSATMRDLSETIVAVDYEQE